MSVVPLAPVVPLVAAALLAAGSKLVNRAAANAVALAAAAGAATLCAIALLDAGDGLAIHWFAGWEPRHGIALGVDFAVDRFGAGLAALVALLTLAALIMLLRYRETAPPYLQALLLTFCAGMIGFCLSGDLFNMFVFFELMSVSAYALTGFKARQEEAVEGSLNFAITNTVGSFVLLLGIALVYGRTGALNLAQIGASLSQAPGDGLVIVAFTLIACGFLVKAAVVPFQAWLADAYAVAPTPVCLLFAGAMSELGIYGVGRIWFSSFEGAFSGHLAAFGDVLVVAGCLTAVLGGVMCLAQDHLKRMLAFAAISLVGSFMIGLGTLNEDGVGGAALFIVADGLNKAALFGAVGIIQHRGAAISERRLHGAGRGLPFTGALLVLGALAFAAVPAFGAFEAKALIEDALTTSGRGWAIPALILGSMLTAAAVLRAAGRIFLGWGAGAEGRGGDAEADIEEEEEETGQDHTPATFFVPAALLTLGSIALGVIPGVSERFVRGAASFVDGDGYARAVLGGSSEPLGGPVPDFAAPASAYGFAALTIAGAILLASVALFGERIELTRRLTRLAGRGVAPLRALHSGHVGDYVAWLVLGVAAFGAAFAVAGDFGG